MNQKIFIVLCFCFMSFYDCYGDVEQNILLQAPQGIDAQEYMQSSQSKTYIMTWNLNNQAWKSCIYHAGKYALSIAYVQLSDNLTDEEKALFKKVCKHGKDYYIYQVIQDGIVIDDLLDYEDEIYDQDSATYYVAGPRIFSDKQPQQISPHQLLEVLKNQKVVLYTGAGISIAADIFSMHELMEQLDLQQHIAVDGFVQKILHEPEKIFEVVQSFFESMIYRKPTRAHDALKHLAQYLQLAVFTENLDNLHEKTEIVPLRINPEFFAKNIPGVCAQQVDVVVCCGLSHDDRGFLAWYKRHNSQGQIIAIDIKQPSYLDDSDKILYGDIQEILPQLWEDIQK